MTLPYPRVRALRSAGTREEEEAESVWARIRRRERRQRPRLAEGGAVSCHEGEGVGGARVEARGMELPEPATRIVHPARETARSDSECGSSGEGLFERDLEQDSRLADRREEVSHQTRIPDLGLR